ncbi:MAG: DUF1573 domain-containing protein [Acidobacteriota bacterium]
MTTTRRKAVLFKLILAAMALCSAIPVTRASDASSLAALRERVSGFYSRIRANQWAHAEEFVLEESRERFRSQPRGTITSFEIVETTLEPDGNSAIVEVTFRVLIPSIVKQVDIPNRNRWRQRDGTWYYDPDNPPPQLADKFQEKLWSRLEKKLPSNVKFEKEEADVGVVPKGQKVTVKFPFTSLSAEALRIEKVYVPEDFMKDVTLVRDIKPRGKGEIIIEIDTSQLYKEFGQTIVVEFPEEMTRLTIKGQVYKASELAPQGKKN